MDLPEQDQAFSSRKVGLSALIQNFRRKMSPSMWTRHLLYCHACSVCMVRKSLGGCRLRCAESLGLGMQLHHKGLERD